MNTRNRFAWALLVGCIVAAPATAQWLDTVLFDRDSIGAIQSPRQVFPNPLTGRVYLPCDDGVHILDPGTMQQFHYYDYATVSYSRVIESRQAGRLYFTGDDSYYGVVDAATDALLRNVNCTAVGELGHAAVSDSARKLYFSNEPEGSGVFVFSTTTDSFLHTALVNRSTTTLQWDGLHDRLWVQTYGEISGRYDRLLVLDCESDSLLDSVVLSVGQDIGPLSICPAHDKLYCGVGSTIYVVSTASRTVTDSIMLTQAPEVTSYDSVLDRLYCWSADGVTLSIIDAATDSVRADLILPDAPQDFASNPTDGRVYLALEKSNDSVAIAVIDAGDSVAGRIYEPLGEAVALGFSPDRDELYAGLASTCFDIFDGAADTLKGRIALAWRPIGNLAYSRTEDKLYVVISEIDSVLVLNSDYEQIASIAAPMGSVRPYVVQSPDFGRLYIIDRDWLHVIDCRNDSLVRSTPMGGIAGLFGVLAPDVNKLYVASTSSSADSVVAYDCATDSIMGAVAIGRRVRSAEYSAVSHRLYVVADTAPVIRAIDVTADTVAETLSAGVRSSDGRAFVHPVNNRLYLYNRTSNFLYSWDLVSGQRIDSVPLARDVDSIFWNRTTDRLFLCRTSLTTGRIYVFDCATGAVVDSLMSGMYRAAVMNETNDELYVSGGSDVTVYSCQSDSVSVLLSGAGAFRCGAWDSLHNRVFMGKSTSTAVSVFADAFPGVTEQPGGDVARFALLANPVRGRAFLRCMVPQGEQGVLTVNDIVGRQVSREIVAGGTRQLEWCALDRSGRRLSAGLYFLRLEVGTERSTAKVVLE